MDRQLLSIKIHKSLSGTDGHFAFVVQFALKLNIIVDIERERTVVFDLTIFVDSRHRNIRFRVEEVQQRITEIELHGSVIDKSGIIQMESCTVFDGKSLIFRHQAVGHTDVAVVDEFAVIDEELGVFTLFKINGSVVVKSPLDFQFAEKIDRSSFGVVECSFDLDIT